KISHQLRLQDPTIPLQIAEIPYSEQWKAYDQGLMMKKDVINAFLDRYEREHLELFFEKAMHTLSPIALGINLLEYVQKQGFATYILSNLPYEFHDFLHRKFSFLKTVNGSVYSCFARLLKPDPRIYLHLLDKYHLNAEELLFIDDLEVNVQA